MTPNLDIGSAQLQAFCDAWNITELSVFGSVLRNDFNAASDVDFLVVFDEAAKIALFDLMSIEDELAELVGRPVDVVTKRAVEEGRSVRRREEILASHEVIYAA